MPLSADSGEVEPTQLADLGNRAEESNSNGASDTNREEGHFATIGLVMA
jgi:hypothetical protein